ncbi:MAG: ATP-binding protein, partial [bacterium]
VLKNLYSLLIQREITSLATLLDQRKTIRLVRLLSAQNGGLLNYSNLAREGGLSDHELRGLLNLLEKTFTIYILSPFFTNKKREVIKNPKVYFIDTGLRNAIIEDFSSLRPDKGVLYESYVFEELLKADLTFHFWRSKSKAEVDFVVKRDHSIIPIEVKAGHPQITRSFRSFIQRYQPDRAFVVNSEVRDEGKLEATLVRKVFFSEVVDLVKEIA